MTIFGTVDIRDFDLGCFLTIKAETIETQIGNEGTRQDYVVNVPRVNSGIARFGNKVPCFFGRPEDPFQHYILPSFVFVRNDPTPAFERCPWYQVDGRAPAINAEQVIVDGEYGYTSYEDQLRGDPYDLTYDLHINARRAQELNMMVAYIMRIMRPPSFPLRVIDSIKDVRYYDAKDISFGNDSELADIADRTMSYTVSFTVMAMIDTFDSIVSPAMIDPIGRFSVINGGNQ